MKKLINDPVHVVDEMVAGMVTAYPTLARLSGRNVLLRSDTVAVRDAQVALISGGGSGHEPAHAGYIGSGMLTAAVAGEVFTSPPAAAVFAAIKAVAGAPGVLLIIKNYTGDRLNFTIAAEMARAERIAVDSVVVADDIALAATHDRSMRRGLAGTVLVHKIAGAAAAEDRSLAEVKAIAQGVADDVATFGLSLSAGIVPAVGKPSYLLGDHEVEVGLGIHGEPGVRRMQLGPADDMASILINGLREARPLSPGQRVILLVNNLGATTGMELAIVTRQAYALLVLQGLVVERIYSGTFMSSLEAAGISFTVLPVDDARLQYLDADTSAPAWPRVAALSTSDPAKRVIADSTWKEESETTGKKEQPPNKLVEAACRSIIDAEPQLTELDQKVGDGDLGSNLARGARALLRQLPTIPSNDSPELLRRTGITLQDTVGGSSGPLYGVLFLRASNLLRQGAGWVEAVSQSCQALSALGGAGRGDRTMLDALLPFSDALRANTEKGLSLKESFTAAVKAAEESAASTAQMQPRKGRSAYLGERAIGQPDPGAVAVTIWLRAVLRAI